MDVLIFESVKDARQYRYEKTAEIQGYVYVIQNECRIKIGRTENPPERFRQLKDSNSGGMTMLRICVMGPMHIHSTLERLLHEYYAPFRTEGEWYLATPDSGLVFEDVVSRIEERYLYTEDFLRCDRVRKQFAERHLMLHGKDLGNLVPVSLESAELVPGCESYADYIQRQKKIPAA